MEMFVVKALAYKEQRLTDVPELRDMLRLIY